jgi:hypothetical protein
MRHQRFDAADTSLTVVLREVDSKNRAQKLSDGGPRPDQGETCIISNLVNQNIPFILQYIRQDNIYLLIR